MNENNEYLARARGHKHSEAPFSIGFPGNVINNRFGMVAAVSPHPDNMAGAEERGFANVALFAAAPKLLAAAIRSLRGMEVSGIGFGEHDLRMAVGMAMGLDPAGVSALIKAEGGAM